MRIFGSEQAPIAALDRQCLAWLIDGAILVTVLTVGAVGAGAYFVDQGRRRDEATIGQLPEDEPSPAWLSSPAVRWGLRIAGGVVAVGGRNWRSPGARIVGIRRVDAQTLGPVTARSALIAYTVRQAWTASRLALFKPMVRDREDRLQASRARLRELTRDGVGGSEAIRAAQTELRQWARSCCLTLVIQLLAEELMRAPALWSAQNQSLPDRLAGIVVINT